MAIWQQLGNSARHPSQICKKKWEITHVVTEKVKARGVEGCVDALLSAVTGTWKESGCRTRKAEMRRAPPRT